MILRHYLLYHFTCLIKFPEPRIITEFYISIFFDDRSRSTVVGMIAPTTQVLSAPHYGPVRQKIHLKIIAYLSFATTDAERHIIRIC